MPNTWCITGDLFKWVCDRNDRNDKGNGKSYMRRIGRGLQISCHSCHLCQWEVALISRQTRQFLAPPVLLLLASDADGQSLPISSITITNLLVALIGQCFTELDLATRLLSRWPAPAKILLVEAAHLNTFMWSNYTFLSYERADSIHFCAIFSDTRLNRLRRSMHSMLQDCVIFYLLAAWPRRLSDGCLAISGLS